MVQTTYQRNPKIILNGEALMSTKKQLIAKNQRLEICVRDRKV